MITFAGTSGSVGLSGLGRRVVAGVAAFAAMAGVLVGATPADAAVGCRDVTTKVQHLGTSATVHGRLCLPAGSATKSIQLLAHGASYNREYWDPAVGNETYSYVRAANAAGHATFAIDRVGVAESTRPLAATLTALADADHLHQLVGQLRAGQIGGVAVDRVVSVGHSLGSIVAIIEAATYQDVAAVVVTGMTHAVTATKLAETLATRLHLATLDPKFASQLNVLGYMTTIPGRRDGAFSVGDVEPAMAAYDEQSKDVFSPTELPDGVALAVLLNYSKRITAPTLVTVGEKDPLICGTEPLSRDCSSAEALRAAESGYYSAAACLRADVLPGAGHLLNYTRDTATYRNGVFSWLSSLGPNFTCPPG